MFHKIDSAINALDAVLIHSGIRIEYVPNEDELLEPSCMDAKYYVDARQLPICRAAHLLKARDQWIDILNREGLNPHVIRLMIAHAILLPLHMLKGAQLDRAISMQHEFPPSWVTVYKCESCNLRFSHNRIVHRHERALCVSCAAPTHLPSTT